ncbi:MAG: type I-G CRISPR-associated helicase/endonuclease Cas3g [Candidatus Methylomirabilia bacterium]
MRCCFSRSLCEVRCSLALDDSGATVCVALTIQARGTGMRDLDAAHFRAFFHALWGLDPFPWQAALAERVLTRAEAPWPEAIAVPTASGKTACMDIAIFALAAASGRPGGPGAAPRRIWFVVDRRVIVDEAYERALLLARKLDEAKDGIVYEVAERLRKLGDSDKQRGKALTAHLLRGGVYRDDAWARFPLQPAVISSTVDQFGSRLLFRAYGHSPKAWSIQAGLAGNDSLVLLDEAHCARPFLDTLRAVGRYRTLAAETLPTSFRSVVLSATPPEDISDRHELGEADRTHPVLGPRLTVSKPTRLLTPVAIKGSAATEILAHGLAVEARGLIDHDAGRLAVVVFCNRVATAKKVFDLLSADAGCDSVLLTGRMRSIDKDDVVGAELGRLGAGAAANRRLERPIMVVATQTLEVGANLDFDGLVSECASLDALRQRMGRLNRMGRTVEARGVLVIGEEQSKESEDDPVYGAALAKTWQWLNEQAGASGEVDFGVGSLQIRLPQGNDLVALNAPIRRAPVLLPGHLDALAQTAPVPCPTPDPALFLHGPDRGAADVQVCWRADLDPGQPEAWADILAFCPPTAAECLPVPFGRMRGWLVSEATPLDTSDVEGAEVENGEEMDGTGSSRWALRWFGRDAATLITTANPLRPGDVVVLPAAGGGLEELGHRPEGLSVDRGDQANLHARGKIVLRLHPSVMKLWPASEAATTLAVIAMDAVRREEDFGGWVEDLRVSLEKLGMESETSGWAWLIQAAGELARDPKLGRLVAEHPGGGVVLRGSRRVRPNTDGGFTDEDDTTASGSARVELDAHMRRVGARARRHGEAVHLPESIIDSLVAAGEAHDLGKADPRFQAWLQGGRPGTGPLLAKSWDMPQHPQAARQARERAGYPECGRHELLSVRLLEAAGLDRVRNSDLIFHLIESHHGHARPFAPVVPDPKPCYVVHPVVKSAEASSATHLERLDSGVAERFWSLTRQYGWWGLPWLESLLRLADHIESAEEQR